MHTDFYNLKEEPFNITPDPDFFYGSATHKEAFLSLAEGIQRRKGFMCLTGPVGSGKTMLSRSILPYIGSNFPSSMIIDPIISPLSLLLTILEDLGIPTGDDPTMKSCHDALNACLMSTSKAGSTTVLIIDEAQHLDTEILEQIRLLSNFETNKEKLIQIILVGQPELNDVLAKHELRQLRQRITVKYDLEPLTRRETGEYISHRIRVAGGEDDLLFDPAAMDRIYDYAKGIPRVTNVLCDHVLTKVEKEQTSEDQRSRLDLKSNDKETLPGFNREQFAIRHISTLEIVDTVAGDLDLELPSTESRPILIKTNPEFHSDNAQIKRELWENPDIAEQLDTAIEKPVHEPEIPEPIPDPRSTNDAPKAEPISTLHASRSTLHAPKAESTLHAPKAKTTVHDSRTTLHAPKAESTLHAPKAKTTLHDSRTTLHAPKALQAKKILKQNVSEPFTTPDEDGKKDSRKEIGLIHIVISFLLLCLFIVTDCQGALYDTPDFMIFVRLLIFALGFAYTAATAWQSAGKKLAMAIIIVILFLFHFNNNGPVLSVVEKLHLLPAAEKLDTDN